MDFNGWQCPLNLPTWIWKMLVIIFCQWNGQLRKYFDILVFLRSYSCFSSLAKWRILWTSANIWFLFPLLDSISCFSSSWDHVKGLLTSQKSTKPSTSYHICMVPFIQHYGLLVYYLYGQLPTFACYFIVQSKFTSVVHHSGCTITKPLK